MGKETIMFKKIEKTGTLWNVEGQVAGSSTNWKVH